MFIIWGDRLMTKGVIVAELEDEKKLRKA